MAKYFMSGTKYEKYERMMMSPDRSARDVPPPKKKPRSYGRNAREKKNLPFPKGEQVESSTQERSE